MLPLSILESWSSWKPREVYLDKQTKIRYYENPDGSEFSFGPVLCGDPAEMIKYFKAYQNPQANSEEKSEKIPAKQNGEKAAPQITMPNLEIFNQKIPPPTTAAPGNSILLAKRKRRYTPPPEPQTKPEEPQLQVNSSSTQESLTSSQDKATLPQKRARSKSSKYKVTFKEKEQALFDTILGRRSEKPAESSIMPVFNKRFKDLDPALQTSILQKSYFRQAVKVYCRWICVSHDLTATEVPGGFQACAQIGSWKVIKVDPVVNKAKVFALIAVLQQIDKDFLVKCCKSISDLEKYMSQEEIENLIKQNS